MRHHTVCRMCSSCCPVTVEVEDGKLISAARKSFVDPEKRAGCAKLNHAAEIVYSPERLTTPLIRDASGELQEAGWDEALNLVATRFKEYRNEGSPQAVGWLRGMAADWGTPWDYANRLMNLFGSPNTIGNGSICFVAREMAHTYTYGAMAFPEAKDADCILVWGKHDHDTTLGVADGINHGIEQGAKLIVVDPVETPLAARADIWLQIKPGHDGLLAMSMINEIIEQDLVDHEFINNHSVGFEELKAVARDFPIDEIAPQIWLDGDQVREAALLYAETRPATLIDGNGLDMQLDIFQSTRAVAMLRGLTGNIDRPGGDVLPQPVPLKNFQERAAVDADIKPITYKYPLFNSFSETWGNQVQSCVMDAVLDHDPYPLKMLVVQAGNPVVTMAESERAVAAMKELEFLVVIDMFMTRTCEHADVILPASSCFEKTQLNRAATRNNPVILQNQVIEPLGDSWPDWKIVFELARRIGLVDGFPWQSAEEAIDDQLASTGIGVSQLREDTGGLRLEPLRHRKYLEEGFSTPSGKFEFFSRRLEDNGFDPVPYQGGIDRHLIGFEDLKEDYPFIGISGARNIRFTNSQYRQIPILLQNGEGCGVDIHPLDCEEMGLEAGELVEIETPKGKIEMSCSPSTVVRRGSVRISWGWGDYNPKSNLNTLTDDSRRNPVTGTPAQRSFRCRVQKV